MPVVRHSDPAYRGVLVLGLKTCAIDGCEKPRHQRYRLCAMHRARKERNGDPLVLKRAHPETCTVPGCDEPYEALGYCNRHYLRMKTHGRVEDVTVADRFWAKVVESPDGCWHWTGALDPHGYGAFNDGTGMVRPHRWAYGHLIELPPPHLDLDHVCHTLDWDCAGSATCMHRRCVNPWHLEPVTSAENTRRALERTLMPALVPD